jgi:predicted PurR-regulated permease PerM
MHTKTRTSERGGARLKFVLVIAILAVVGYAGYLFIPVFYQSYQIKDLMQNDVDTASSMGKPTSWIQEQLLKSFPEYGVPANAVITPTQQSNRMEVRVQYTIPVAFPGYVYNYEFDHTAKSGTFLNVK